MSFEMMPRCVQLLLALGGELLILGVGGVARELRFGLREQRLVAHQVRLGLRERRLERPAIEREEQLPLLDEVAFVEATVARATPVTCERSEMRGVRLDVADGGDVDRHVLRGDFGRDDRRRGAVAAAPASASAATGSGR